MELIHIDKAAELKGASSVTLRGAIHAGKLNREIKWEKRNGYERKIVYIVNDEKFQAYKLKNQKKGESDAYIEKCDYYGYEPNNIITRHLLAGDEEYNKAGKLVTHARYLPLDI